MGWFHSKKKNRKRARKKLDNVQPIELTVEHDKTMTSSLQVAKHFGKQHNNILRDIEVIKKEVPSEWFAVNFEPISNITDLGHAQRKAPAYMMTRDGFTFMAMGFTGKKASQMQIDSSKLSLIIWGVYHFCHGFIISALKAEPA